jgi:hypothetical protein
MAAVPPHATATPAVPARPAEDKEVTVVSHSNLFYWWPVWAVGFLLGILTYLDGHYLAVVPSGVSGYTSPADDKSYSVVVPKGTRLLHDVKAPKEKDKDGNEKGADKLYVGDGTSQEDVVGRDVLILPSKEHVSNTEPRNFERLHIARSPKYGVIFSTILLLVIVITNVPLRGLWSVVVIILVVLFTIILALLDWWDIILEKLNLLDIRVNAGGYFFISGILFGIWLVSLLIFDRQIYMIFSPGQLKVCTQIGGGERVFDSTGMKLEKQRSDLFRHWILGLGSGDLIVRTSGAGMEHLELDNVLFIGKKTQQIERLMKTKSVEAK